MKLKIFLLILGLYLLAIFIFTAKSTALEQSLWNLTELNGQPQKEFPSDIFGITLELSDHKVSGHNGCGRYDGHYFVLGKVLFFPGKIWLTGTHCLDEISQHDDEYWDALKDTFRYIIQDDQLHLLNIEGESLAVFTAQSEEGLAGSWWRVVYFIDNRQNNIAYPFYERIKKIVDPLSGTTISLRFLEDQLGGSGGCNDYFGRYEIENGSIQITERGNSVMACPEPSGLMEQEALYFIALRSVTAYRVDGDYLELLTAGDEIAVSLVRVP